MGQRTNEIIELTLLAVTALAVLALLGRSLWTGQDIPSGWAMLIGSAWGGLLGVRELLRRSNGRDDDA